MEVGVIAPPPEFADEITEDYTAPPNFARLRGFNLNLKDSEKTIVKSEDSPIDVMTKLITCLIALDTIINQPQLPKPPPLPPSDANATKVITKTQPTTEHFFTKVEPKMQTDATSWHCNPTNRPMLVQASVTAKRKSTENAIASAKIQDMQVNNPCKIWLGTELPSERPQPWPPPWPPPSKATLTIAISLAGTQTICF